MNNRGNSILEKIKMTNSGSREGKGFQAKKEGNIMDYAHVLGATSSCSRSPWSAFRNPRIVRVSGSFRGKDRHSKVFTIRGLRDRRIRLSVPAALQLYDLQEKLGLNQPSKVIDWLLDVTRYDIDKLPPLRIPQEYNPFNPSMTSKLWFSPFSQANPTSMKHGLLGKDNGIDINEDLIGSEREKLSISKSNLLNMGDLVRTRSKEIERESVCGKGKWINNSNVQESLEGIGSDETDHVMPQNFIPIPNYNFSLSSNLSNNRMIPYYQCESSNSSSSSLSSSHFGIGLAPASEQYCLNTNLSSSSSSLNLPPRAQFCFCPPPPDSTPLIPSYSPIITTPLMENEVGSNPYQFFSSSSSQHILPSIMPSLTNFRFITPLGKNSCQSNKHDDSS